MAVARVTTAVMAIAVDTAGHSEGDHGGDGENNDERMLRRCEAL
jgi:hypothetical protein